MRPSPMVRLAAATAALPCLAAPAAAGPLAPIWAGAYAGIDLGFAGGSLSIPGVQEELTGSAFVGGGHVGYNFQIGSLVAGVEADAMLSPGTEKTYGAWSYAMDTTWTASIRGRVGFTIANVLLYGTGGYAFSGNTQEYRFNGQVVAKADATSESFVVGGGLEARFMPGVSLRLEGLHYFEASSSLDVKTLSPGLALQELTPGVSVVRAGLSFQLN